MIKLNDTEVKNKFAEMNHQIVEKESQVTNTIEQIWSVAKNLIMQVAEQVIGTQ